MAVTTTYAFDFVENVDTNLPGNESGADAVGLANGGFAVAVTETGGSVVVETFDAAGVATASGAVSGADPSIAQLEDGSVVVTAAQGGDVTFTAFDPTDGSVVITETNLGDNNTSAPDVAALDNGGFVIVTQDNFSPTDNDIDVRIFNADGTPVTTFTIDSSGADDRNPSVAAMNGGFVVAWERHLPGGETQLLAVEYNNAGATLIGNDIAQGPLTGGISATALPDGGFALAWTESGVINVGAISGTTGDFIFDTTLAGIEPNASSISITVLSNGMLAVTYQEDGDGPTDIDTHVVLVDPTTGAVLDDSGFNFAIGNQTNPTVAAMSLGRVAVFSDVPGDNIEGEIRQAVRTSTGDGAVDEIVGDDLVDIIDGQGGGDTIRGGANADELSGGAGNDRFEFTAGDVLAGETIAGGADFDTISTSGGGLQTVDFTAASFITGIEAVEIFGTVIFRADQAQALLPTGLTLSNAALQPATFQVQMGAQANLDLSGLTFGSWGANDRVEVVGDDAGETITGSSQRDTLNGNGGVDTLNGGNGNDSLEGGADGDTLDGGEGDDVIEGGTGGDALNGGNGVDTLSYAGSSEGVNVSLAAASRSGGDAEGDSISVSSFENVTGSAHADTLSGSFNDNELHGGDDDDALNGQSGVDRLFGEGGNDVIADNNINNEAGEYIDGGFGTDTLTLRSFAGGFFDTPPLDLRDDTLVGLENLHLETPAGIGPPALYQFNASQFGFTEIAADAHPDDVLRVQIFMAGETELDLSGTNFSGTWAAGDGVDIFGGDIAETITGSEIADTIDGGGANDTLAGGLGDDTLIGGFNADTLNGGDDNDTLEGGFSIDTIDGGGGDDTIIVREDEFADDVEGGAGVDLYAFQYSSFQVLINLEAGTLQTFGGSFAVSGIENVTGGGGDDTITGNGGNSAGNQLFGLGASDTLTGFGGADRLDGGAGADAMVGGNGDDTYVVEDAGDTASEASGSGTDLVQSTVTFTLAAGVENLALNGTTAINGTGNASANVITGNSAANTLSGLGASDTLTGFGGADRLDGGADADTMAGGNGNDTYFVDNAGDTASEASGSGTDLVQSAVSFTLASGIENLALTGTTAVNATGNAAANTMSGNSAANRLDGDSGADTLTGFGAADVFVFDDGDGADTVTDFQNGNDKFDLTAVDAVDDFSDLTVIDNGATVTVNYGTGSFALANVPNPAQVDASDFVI